MPSVAYVKQTMLDWRPIELYVIPRFRQAPWKPLLLLDPTSSLRAAHDRAASHTAHDSKRTTLQAFSGPGSTRNAAAGCHGRPKALGHLTWP